MKRRGRVLLACAVLCGCTRSAPPRTGARQTPGTAGTMINGLTGKTAVDAGRKAQADITRISEARHRDLDAAME